MEYHFIALEKIIISPRSIRAHLKENEKKEILRIENLEEHTMLCQQHFQRLVAEKELEQIFEQFISEYFCGISEAGKGLFYTMLVNVITFHDVGKINPYFQSMIMRNEQIVEIPAFRRVKTYHSGISAVLYIDYFLSKINDLPDKEEKKQLRDCLLFHSYLIARHHSDLLPMETYMSHLETGMESYVIEIFSELSYVYQSGFSLNAKKVKKICDNAYIRMKSQEPHRGVILYLYERLIYSLLVASDYYATSEFMEGVSVHDTGNINEIQDVLHVYESSELAENIRLYERTVYPQSKMQLQVTRNINVLRSELFLDAEQNLKKAIDQDIFYLEAPTGSGKSNTAMNLSFQLMKEEPHLKKIYYIYPFNTLVEQNLKSINKLFGGHEEIMDQVAVINSITPIKMNLREKMKSEEESNAYYAKALLNRQFLNYPIIISTHVSLFDTMFGDTKEAAFGFHQLANSVVVLDEIQSYKNTIWGEMIVLLKAIARLLHMKIIMMSATLPNLELLTENAMGTAVLLKDRDKYFSHPKFKNRVQVKYELLEVDCNSEQLLAHMQPYIKADKKILIEFIKRESAFEFFQLLKHTLEENVKVLYMSGDDSAIERNRILNMIDQTKGETIILVATQVIEAGVDIDMDIGYKNISKLDSEEQLMGRINRSGLGEGTVYFFKFDDAKRIYGEDARLDVEFTLQNKEMRNVLSEKKFYVYYEKVLRVIKHNYNDRHDAVGLEGFLKQQVGTLDFLEVKKRMQLIEEDRWSMSVYLSRVVKDENGDFIDGNAVWEVYKELLKNQEMPYAKKKIELSKVTSQMNYFIYQIKKNNDLIYDDQIGELYYIEDGEKFFEEGKLNRKKVQGELGDFVDFI